MNPTDSSSQIGAQQAAIGRFIREPANGAESQVDRSWGQTPRFQVTPITKNHNAIECEARFGAIPVDELVNRVIVSALCIGVGETAEHG
jgi:hypothetical protein